MTIDINRLRASHGGDPEEVRRSEVRRGRDGLQVDVVINLDEEWRKAQYDVEKAKASLNIHNKGIRERKKMDKADDCSDILTAVGEVKELISDLQDKAKQLSIERSAAIKKIGNIVDDRVHVSNDEQSNEVIRVWKPEGATLDTFKEGDSVAGKKRHHEILAAIAGFNPKKGSEIAGHRGFFLTGPGVLLNQALWSYGQSFLVQRGYCPVQPPMFMKKSVMTSCAELADFEETLYRIPDDENNEDNDLFLIATSEQPLCALHMNENLELKNLPKRYAGISSCFRKEAGSHGKDSWGVFRVHQFEKIEQFIICSPEKSKDLHEEMISCSEDFMKSLGLPYQVIRIVSGALNDAAAMKYDLEAWFPGYGAYRELVSCSNCTDYQSRPLSIRLGYNKQDQKEKTFVHLLNGTLCATERTLCCILENYQTEEGVVVPEPLRPFMGDVEFIPFS